MCWGGWGIDTTVILRRKKQKTKNSVRVKNGKNDEKMINYFEIGYFIKIASLIHYVGLCS